MSWFQWALELLFRKKPTYQEMLNGIVPIPGPPPIPLIGSVLDVDINDTLKSVIDLMRDYGPIIQLYTGSTREIIVGSQELANELSDEKRFCKVVYGALHHLRDAGGDGLFTAQHGNHEARHGPEASIDAVDDFTRLTVDTITLCAMNYRLNSFYLNNDMHAYVKSLSRVLVESDKKAQFPDAINAMRFKADAQYRADIKTMADICKEIIRKRRSAGPDPDSKLLLDLMIHGVDPKTGDKLSDDAIMWNLHTFLIAGHDTTSGLLSFAFYFLLANPDKMAKARMEVDSILKAGEPMTLKHLQKLPYLDAVLKETIRLHAPAPGFHVRPLKDGEVLGGKYVVNKEDPIVIVLHQLHRDPAVWGSDAEEFKPERMQRDGFNKLPPNSWKPFGNGARACIGRAFAWQEALMAMAMLLQHFDFKMDDANYKLKVVQTLTIKPDGFRMKARLRHEKKPGDLFKHESQPTQRKTNPNAQRPKPRTEPAHPMTILYGSNTGTGEALARWLAGDAMAAGFEALTVTEMNNAVGKLPKDQPVVIIAASYNGYPSDNADDFVKWLSGLATSDLQGVSYSVFGLGHSDWVATHNKVPILVNDMMKKAGAVRLTEATFSDMATADLFADAERWSMENLWPALAERYDVQPVENVGSDMTVKIEPGIPGRLATRRGFFRAAVTQTQQLSHPGVPQKHHLTLRLPAEVRFQTGDRLQILPKNGQGIVNRALSRFQLDHDAVLTISSARTLGLPVDTPISAEELLGTYVELGQPASQRNIKTLVDATESSDSGSRSDVVDEATKTLLLSLAEDLYEVEIRAKHISVLDLLEKFPSVNLPFARFLSMLPQMRPRTYSISSSPVKDPHHIDLTISVADCGVATNFLTAVSVGQLLYASLFPAPREFRLPASPSTTPIIMIAAGAGLAPFRGFVQERAQAEGLMVPALLFYGCRGADLDDMYRTEFNQYESLGVVKVHRAFSRDPGAEFKYVTDCIQATRDELMKRWDEGAVVYVCGGKKMSDGVFDVLGPMLYEADKKSGKSTAQDTDRWEQELPRERYVREIFN
ncbi:Bifunctional cytochrome P450/NADPH--P450 reductase [Colletotrichum fructicola]|nr:Bifunctional cytochrome P450/NADPH--P450 reductase [Colletotrichum fructicola]KAF4903466.1 Bifunctional cytochrome P450/NADPH--P450 reductase [Colletotrichum fructicola]KAF4922866.1 Bifunctional cytochrome P450/NADPH--P450 reductase [Colletotrichum fructicola]